VPAKYQDILTFNVSVFHCITPGQLVYFSQDTATLEKQLLNLYIQTCQNSSANNNSCYSMPYITNYLENGNIHVEWYLPTATVNHYNTTNPLQDYYYHGSVRIFLDYYYTFFSLFTMTFYDSDDGAVFSSSSNYQNFAYDPSQSYNQLSQGNFQTAASFVDTFALFQFSINTNYGNYFNRSYEKLQTVVAMVGGMMNFIIVCGQVLGSLTDQIMTVELSNRIVHHAKGSDNKYRLSRAMQMNKIIDFKGLPQTPNIPLDTSIQPKNDQTNEPLKVLNNNFVSVSINEESLAKTQKNQY